MDNATGFAKALQLHTSNFVTLTTHNLHKIDLSTPNFYVIKQYYIYIFR